MDIYDIAKSLPADWISSRSQENSDSGCLEWQGAKTSGYGRAKINGKMILIHRLSFVISNPGVAIEGLDVCHSCDNRSCCNPNHLFLGTRSDNMIDCRNKGRLPDTCSPGVSSKVPVNHAVQFLELLKQGVSARSIARDTGMSHATITRAARRAHLWLRDIEINTASMVAHKTLADCGVPSKRVNTSARCES